MKKFLKFVFTIITIIGLIFLYGYYKKIKRDLVDYNISEKLVVKFEDDDNNYLVNLNDGNYIKYDGSHIKYFPISYEDEKIFYNKKNYNKDSELFFYYSAKNFSNKNIYDINYNIIYNYPYSDFLQKYWSQDGKYLIARSGYIERMFGLFLQIETANPVFTIIEPETGKMKQLILGKPGDKFINIEKILGYVK